MANKKGLISRMMEQLTDKDFFESKTFLGFVDNMIKSVSNKFGKRVTARFFKGSDSDTAFTSPSGEINVSYNNSFTNGKSMKEKFHIYLGMVLHEMGHLLYTPMTQINCAINNLAAGVLLPYDTPTINKVAIKNGKRVSTMLHTFMNIVEDGYIELRILDEYAGYAVFLKYLRFLIYHFYDEVNIEEMRNNGADEGSVATHLLCMYARHQRADEDESTVAGKALAEAIPYIDEALSTDEGMKRFEFICIGFDRFMEVLIKNNQSSNQQSNQSQLSQQSNEGESANDSEGEGSEGNSNGQSDNQSKESASSNQNGEISGSGFDDEENSDEGSNASDKDDTSESSTGSQSSAMSEEEAQEKALEQMKGLEDGSLAPSNSFSDSDAKGLSEQLESMSSNTFDKLKEEIGDEKVGELLQKERKEMLNTLKSNMDFSDYHKNVNGKIQNTQPNVNRCSELNSELSPLARRMVRDLEKVFEDMREGEIERGLFFGRKLDKAYARDMRKFKNVKAPEDVPDFSVCLLVDLSGSMRGSRIENARKAAFLVAKACARLGIKLAVYGHCDGRDWNNVTELYCYKEFDETDGKDLARIASMDAKSARNRDGYALRFCMERLKSEDSLKKMLMIISDGAPNGENYGYNYIPKERRTSHYSIKDSGNAKVDIQEVLQDAYRSSIKVVTAGLGNDSMVIEDIYTDGLSKKTAAEYLRITELDEMPGQLVKIIKKMAI